MNGPAADIDVDLGGTCRVAIMMHGHQAAKLAAVVGRFRELEAEWAEQEITRLVKDRQLEGQDARRIAAASAVALRPKLWPTQDIVLEQLIRARLTQPDVADLQGPLADPQEEKMLRLPGKRPGSATRRFSTEVGATLPVELVVAGRRAAWRLSGGAESELRTLLAQRRNPEARMTQWAYRTVRKALVARIVTWADLVRDAIDRFEV